MLNRKIGLPVGLLYGPSHYGNFQENRLDIHLDDLSLFGKPVLLRFETSGNPGAGHAPTEVEWELAGWLVAIFPQLSPWLSSILAECGTGGSPSRLQQTVEIRIVINRAQLATHGSDRWSLVLVGHEESGFHPVFDFSGTVLMDRRDTCVAE